MSASIAGAMARKSSIASSPLTPRSASNFFHSALQSSQIRFNAVTNGSSLRPLGVDSRGNSICSAAWRAASQFKEFAKFKKLCADIRNFSPYPAMSAASAAARVAPFCNVFAQYPAFRRTMASSSRA